MTNLMMFKGNEVEVFNFEEKVLFNPYHVGECLGITREGVKSAIKRMSEKQVVKLTNKNVSKGSDRPFRKLHNTGENFITESGVYKLIFKSQKEEAEQFQDWVTDEVLPTIRKTGGYVSNSEMMVNTYFGALDEGHKAIIKGLFDNIEQQQKEIAIQKPKAEYYDKLVERNHLTNFRDTAKELGIKQNLMIAILLDKKIVYRDSFQNLKPYARFADKGYFELKDFHRGNRTGVQTLITPDGKEYISKVIKREEKQLA